VEIQTDLGTQQELKSPIDFIRTPTPQFRAFVSQQKALLSESRFSALIVDIKAAFEQFSRLLAKTNPGVERAKVLHRQMDEILQGASTLAVTCRKGCGGCCHYEVEVTEDEGALLAEEVLQGFQLDVERLGAQARRERKSPEWSQFWKAENRCVFLSEEGACQVYESRPSICRKHQVVSPKEACTTPGEQVSPVSVPMSEVLLSAALSIEGASTASLSKMLVKSLSSSLESKKEDS
jgi:Fe-S-cluster containining protein